MANCWSIGVFLIILLGSFCIWNCMTRDVPPDTSNWYGCRDQKGSPVDSFVVYKLPHDKEARFGPLRNGTAYMYLTPETADRLQGGGVSSVFSEYRDSASGWVLSNVNIGSEFSMPARTLSRLYTDQQLLKNAAFLMYNDEFPNGTKSFTKGHTKGVVVMTVKGGFWLVHSVPKYPPPPENGYSYPISASRYGQTMLCISLPPDQSQNLGLQLLQNNPYVYASNMPDSLTSQFSMLLKVMQGERPLSAPWYSITTLNSIGGKSFTSFAKYKNYDEDLYSGLVAPVLETEIVVESWRNGPQPLNSTCNVTYKVENVESVVARAASTSFTTHRDHSKWVVAVEPDKPYVCIGDINRMESQLHRAGGTVCMQSLSIWHRFHNLVQSVETCPKTV
ncbi:deoxyribonuclease-2-alpha-like [Homarus americanus]|uniref:Deoxyribonuclease-2-alpha-like n=1 Tax=Homarus americanus TaxID=6706 RepID=A0A8J5MWC5_HOMAM|nr:deoxyribonuclease-2-alpha-like [Homarus americanus]KAG7166253.1 Deoxyribonuclease-2-alpha-like [Homarus americanus]